MDPESAPLDIDQQGNRELYRLKIAIEHTDDGDDPEPPLDLARVGILQDPILRYPLTKVSSRRWETMGFIVLFNAAKAVDCVIKSGDGEDILSLYLEGDVTHAEVSGREYTHCRDVEVRDTRVHLAVLWTLNILRQNGLGHQVESIDFGAAILKVHNAIRSALPETPAGFTEVITHLRRASGLCRWCYQGLPSLVGLLAVCLQARGEMACSLPDIDEAISLQGTVVNLLPEDKVRPRKLLELGRWFRARFTHTDIAQDLSNAILMAREVLQSAPESKPSLLFLGGCLAESFTHFGHLSDLDDAISTSQRLAKMTTIGHPSLPVHSHFIAVLMLFRFKSTGLLMHIDEAVSEIQTAVEAAPVGCDDLPVYLHEMGSILMHRFECSGCLSDRDKSIKAHRRAVELTGPGHQLFPSSLKGLALSLHTSSIRTGSQLELEEGVLLLQRAIDLTPEGDEHLTDYHNDLGRIFGNRFRPTNMLDTLERVGALRRAVKAHQSGDKITLYHLLNHLAQSLSYLSEISGDLSYLQEAIITERKLASLAQRNFSFYLPVFLAALVQLLLQSWGATGNLSDLDECISILGRNGNLFTNLEAPNLAIVGRLWMDRYQVTHNAIDMANAISTLEEAIQIFPPGHASLPDCYWDLGVAYYIRFSEIAYLIRDTGSNPSMSTQTLAQYKEDEAGWRTALRLAATLPVRNLESQLRAALWWAAATMMWLPKSPDTLVAFDAAMSLLTMKAGLGQTIRTLHIQLQSHITGGIAAKAASVACNMNQPDKALEWLEQGRCLVWNQINCLRTPLDDLFTHSLSLAERLMKVSRQLEIAGSSSLGEHSHMDLPLRQKITRQEEATAHLSLAKQWDELLGEVRTIPGFESFLQPAKCSALLQNLPESGVIVIVNVNDWGSEAIALLDGLDEPFHIPLPNFSGEKAKKHQQDLGSQLRSRQLRLRGGGAAADVEHGERAMGGYRQPRGTPIRRVLSSLWVDVVRPILDALAISKFEGPPGKEPPRIWWCPTGALSFLPLHAAGIYIPGVESESGLDYVVSSYTPTVSSLTARVRSEHCIDESVSGLFLTSQPNVPGLSKIPGTTAEVRSIYNKAVHNGIRAKKIEGDDLTVEQCLNCLDEYSSVHLACHGLQHSVDSLKSRFRFHNGTLDLATILRKDLKNADLAFLSACQTSTGDEKLPDEAVHLAAGMLAAGYRRVVATMWSIGDITAQEVANDFYDYLWRDREPGSGSGFDGSKSAYALHHAIQKLREKLRASHSDTHGDTDDDILAWAPFVHFGY